MSDEDKLSAVLVSKLIDDIENLKESLEGKIDKMMEKEEVRNERLNELEKYVDGLKYKQQEVNNRTDGLLLELSSKMSEINLNYKQHIIEHNTAPKQWITNAKNIMDFLIKLVLSGGAITAIILFISKLINYLKSTGLLG